MVEVYKKIVLRSENDLDQKYLIPHLQAIKPNVKANLYDLSCEVMKIGFSVVDYTDTISEGATIDKMHYVIFKNGLIIHHVHEMKGLKAALFMAPEVPVDSADRQIDFVNETTFDGLELTVRTQLRALLNLKTGNFCYEAHVSCRDPAVSVAMIGLTLDAQFYSERPVAPMGSAEIVAQINASGLDRNTSPDGKGRYSLIDNRTNKVVHNGDPVDDFFVIKLKDACAVPALEAYAAAREALGDHRVAFDVRDLVARAGVNHPHCKKPD